MVIVIFILSIVLGFLAGNGLIEEFDIENGFVQFLIYGATGIFAFNILFYVFPFLGFVGAGTQFGLNQFFYLGKYNSYLNELGFASEYMDRIDSRNVKDYGENCKRIGLNPMQAAVGAYKIFMPAKIESMPATYIPQAENTKRILAYWNKVGYVTDEEVIEAFKAINGAISRSKK